MTNDKYWSDIYIEKTKGKCIIMNNKTISVIIPVYNVEKELTHCIDSVVNQTYEELEIILVDDGSTDNCSNMCDEFARNDSRIIVVHKKNGGLSDARNCGLRIATGFYVMYVDSDDYIELDSCEMLINAAEKNVDIVVGALREVKDGKVTFQRHSNLIPNVIYTNKDYIINSIIKREFWAPAVLNLYNRQFLIDNELYFKTGCYFEDVEMLPRLFLAAHRITYLDYPFYNYVIRQNSITTSGYNPKKRDSSIELLNNWACLINNIEDEYLKKYLYGMLIKFYLHFARQMHFSEWLVEGVDLKNALKYGLDKKEKIKSVIFSLFPKLYLKL